MSLQDELLVLQQQISAMVPKEVDDMMGKIVDDLKSAKHASNGLGEGDEVNDFSLQNIYVGSTVPDFALFSQAGEEIRLSELLKGGAVLINFYRGGWCPYCDLELKALERALPEIEANNGQLIAITLESPDSVIEARNDKGLSYLVLSDMQGAVAEQFGLIYQYSPEQQFLFDATNTSIPDRRGGIDKSELVIPASYIIDQNFKIRYAFVEDDFRRRADIEEIIDTLKMIKQESGK